MYLGFIRAMPGKSLEDCVKQSALDEDGKQESKKLLKLFGSVFPKKFSGLPPKRSFEHGIKTIDDVPVYRSQYRLSPKELDALKEQVTEMLESDLARPSKSPYSAPILFVKKSDGSLRMVLDYRALNKKIGSLFRGLTTWLIELETQSSFQNWICEVVIIQFVCEKKIYRRPPFRLRLDILN